MTAIERRHKYDFVPDALRGKFPKNWVLLVERGTRIACEVAILLGAFCVLYGTLLGRPYGSEWLYLLAASLGPPAFAAWYVAFPFKPYRSTAAIQEGMSDRDHKDDDAKEFALVFDSPDAHRFLLSTARKLSLLFFVPMAIISAGMQQMPIWRVGADTLIRIPFFFFCLFVLFRIELLNWALRSSEAAKTGAR